MFSGDLNCELIFCESGLVKKGIFENSFRETARISVTRLSMPYSFVLRGYSEFYRELYRHSIYIYLFFKNTPNF